jgi:hypothetical protein
MHTTAEDLHPSRELLELLRLARAIGKSFGEATIDVGAVHAIETDLGATLGDDLLIIMATRDRDLACASGLDIETLLDVAEDEGEVAEGYVAIARLDHDPLVARDDGAHGGAFQTVGIPRPGDRTSGKIMVDAVAETNIASFARDNFMSWLRRNDNWVGIMTREKSLPLEDETFKPALTGKLVVKAKAPERTVAHPKFGRGKVVEEKTDAGDLKLVIDFESAGRKILLAKFVTDA